MKFYHSIYWQRGGHLISSILVFTAQRLPFLKNLAPIFSPGALRFAAPVTVQVIGTDCLSGQSVKVAPAGDSTNPEIAVQGEEFVWLFNTTGRTARSYSISELPPGLTFTFGNPISFISGIPTESGDFSVEIIGWRAANQTGNQTPPFTLNIAVTEAATISPFANWSKDFWTEEELANEDISGENADPDQDGIENVLEFVLNLDPNLPESFPGVISPDPSDSDTLLFKVPVNPDGAEFVQFQKNDNLDSENWEPVSDSDPNFEIAKSQSVTFRTLRIKKSAAAKNFFRVAVDLSVE